MQSAFDVFGTRCIDMIIYLLPKSFVEFEILPAMGTMV